MRPLPPFTDTPQHSVTVAGLSQVFTSVLTFSSLLCEEEIRKQWRISFVGIPDTTYSTVWNRMKSEDEAFFRAYALRTRFSNQLMARAFLWAAMARA